MQLGTAGEECFRVRPFPSCHSGSGREPRALSQARVTTPPHPTPPLGGWAVGAPKLRGRGRSPAQPPSYCVDTLQLPAISDSRKTGPFLRVVHCHQVPAPREILAVLHCGWRKLTESPVLKSVMRTTGGELGLCGTPGQSSVLENPQLRPREGGLA